MAYTYSHTIYLNVGSTEMPVEIQYTVEPGFAGDRVDPPCPPCAEIISATVTVRGARHECPAWMLVVMSASDRFHDELVGYATEQSQPDPDAAYDAARDASMAVRS